MIRSNDENTDRFLEFSLIREGQLTGGTSPLPRVSIVARDVNQHEVGRLALIVDDEPITESQTFKVWDSVIGSSSTIRARRPTSC